MKYLIGIDSGTQSTRAIMFDEAGKEICKASENHLPIIREQKGWAEHDEYDLWNALCNACKKMMDQFTGDVKDIAGLGIAAQSNTICFMSNDGKQLARPVSYQDGRIAQVPPMPDDCPAWENFQRSYSKANWNKINRPELYEKTGKYVSVSGFLTYMLSGKFSDTTSNQVGHWPLDRENWKWEERMWVYDCVGIRPDQLPEIYLPGHIIAVVSKEGSEATGLPEGLPIVACARDKQVEALGAGAIKPGQSYITLGTSAGLALVSDKFQSMTRDNFFYTWLSCVPGIWNYEMPMPKGFWLVSWFRDNFSGDLKAAADKEGVSVETLLNREAEMIPPGSEGLVIVPEWQAARARPNGKGVMMGFDARHTRAHVFKALLEGIFYQLRLNGENMIAKVGGEINEIFVGGGGSRSDIALQACADIFGVKVTRAGSPETCSLGAAMSAAVGTGIYASQEEAVEKMSSDSMVFYPNEKNHEIYERVYQEVFKNIYNSLVPYYRILDELF